SNHGKGLQASIDQLLDRKSGLADAPGVAEARKLLPPDPLAWAWLNLEPLRQAPQFKDVFSLPSNNPVFPLLLGGYVDLLRRAPFLTGGLYRSPDGFAVTLRLPRGRDGMAPEVAAHVPSAGQPGSRPLLRPKNVIFSTSYFYEIAKLWEHRAKLLNEQ